MGELRYTPDGDPLPGSDRRRERYGASPTLIGEIREGKFAPLSWAANERFPIPDRAREFFTFCESPAEAYFVQPFAARAGVTFSGKIARDPDGTTVELQVKHGLIRLDAVVENAAKRDARFAVEIDGMTFHRANWDQVDKDYLRARRVTALGYSVVRFTARDVFNGATECWRQLDAILSRRGASF